MKRFFFLLLAFCSWAAHAQQTCTLYSINSSGHATSWYPTRELACNAWNHTFPVADPITSKTISGAHVVNNVCYATYSITYKNGTSSTSEIYAAFLTKPGSGDQCALPTHCSEQAGAATVVNWTVGYTRTPNIDTEPNWTLVGPPNKVPQSGQLCEPTSGCTVSLGAASKVWQSASPTCS